MKKTFDMVEQSAQLLDKYADELVICQPRMTQGELFTSQISNKLFGTQTPSERIADIYKELTDTFIRKNADYGNSFEESLNEDGLIAAKVRMMDKMRRFSTLITSEAMVKDESIVDTLKDLANYAVMTVDWIQERERLLQEVKIGDIVEVTKCINDNDLGKIGRIIGVYGEPKGYEVLILSENFTRYVWDVVKVDPDSVYLDS